MKLKSFVDTVRVKFIKCLYFSNDVIVSDIIILDYIQLFLMFCHSVVQPQSLKGFGQGVALWVQIWPFLNDRNIYLITNLFLMNKINILILKSDWENIVFSVLQVNTKCTFWMKMDIMTGLLSLTERQHLYNTRNLIS